MMDIKAMSNEELERLAQAAGNELSERKRLRAEYLVNEIYKLSNELNEVWHKAEFYFEDTRWDNGSFSVRVHDLKAIYL